MEVNIYLAVFIGCYGFLIAVLLWQLGSNPAQLVVEFRQLKNSVFQRRSAAEWLALLKARVLRQRQPPSRAETVDGLVVVVGILFWVGVFWLLGAFRN